MPTITCEQARPWLERVADGQMTGPPEGLMEHCRECPDCAAAVERIQVLKRRVREAVVRQPVPVGLETRMRANLRSGHSPNWWMRPVWQAAAACCALVALTAGAWMTAYRPMRMQLASLLQMGESDHVHCTLERKKPPFGELQRPLPGHHDEIVPVAQKAMPAGFTMAESHTCRVQGRAFTHLVFSNGRQRISVIVTGKKEGEALPAARLFSKMKADGIAVYQDRIGGLQTAAMETAHSLGFVVSDLPEQENLRIMAAIAATVTAVDR